LKSACPVKSSIISRYGEPEKQIVLFFGKNHALGSSLAVLFLLLAGLSLPVELPPPRLPFPPRGRRGKYSISCRGHLAWPFAITGVTVDPPRLNKLGLDRRYAGPSADRLGVCLGTQEPSGNGISTHPDPTHSARMGHPVPCFITTRMVMPYTSLRAAISGGGQRQHAPVRSRTGVLPAVLQGVRGNSRGVNVVWACRRYNPTTHTNDLVTVARGQSNRLALT
jgi:hypothetical protein